MKRIYKKILSIVLLVFIGLSLTSFNINKTKIQENHRQQLLSQVSFSNDFFSSDITINDKAENLIYFSDIYNLIETHMNNNTYPDVDSRDTAIAAALTSEVGTKRIGIRNADELYNLSVSASFNYVYTASVNRQPYAKTIQKILGYDYILLADIDYSTMKSQKFVPLGVNIIIEDSGTTEYHYPFTGSFDGQGFVIKNLYLADYNTVTTIQRFDNDPLTDVDIPLSSYYAMFTEIGSNAKVKNFILQDPIYELINVPEGLNNSAYIVGLNKGEIYNVAVIDKKTNQQGADISGIRFNFLDSPSANIEFTAAGFVHTNDSSGKIYNSFIVTKNVMALASQFYFTTKPFYYNNEGTINGAAYDEMVEASVDNIVQIDVDSYLNSEIVSGISGANPISINDEDLEDEKYYWHFYANDGLPQLFGLNYNSSGGYFEIHDEYDFIAFNKLINLTTRYNDIAYNYHKYVLVNDIDLKNTSSYKTPTSPFRGELSGGEGDFNPESTLNNNKYIYNLVIQSPAVIGGSYYLGLFSTVSGTIKNINLYNNELIATNTKDHYGKTFYIGSLAGKTENANIKNIISDTEINLGTNAIGTSYVGGIVGFGNGVLNNLVNVGKINGANHNFDNLTTDGKFYIGGILGASSGSGLNLSYALNKGEIIGPSSDTNFSVKTNDFIKTSIGGIIGEVNNQETLSNKLYYLRNEGAIKAGSFTGDTNKEVYQYLGGILGNTINNGFTLVESDNKTIRSGRFENLGDIYATHLNNYTTYYTAGIGVASTTNALANFSYMINKGSYNFTGFNSNTHNNTIYYAATIIDNSSGGVKLSRAYNNTSFVYDNAYFVSESSLTTIAPFFTSITNNDSNLLYVENRGNITVGTSASQTTVDGELRVAGITLATKVNYTNVYNSGDIKLLRLDNTSGEIYVAGIGWILAYNTATNKAYKAINVLNEGNITTAGISGNTELSNIEGTSNDNFSSTLVSRNLYVAGLFNLNVGEILNSYNRGSITSSDASLTTNQNNLRGTLNTYVGGLVTINYNLIQDVGNSGNIIYTNENTSAATYVANVGSYTAKFGGLTIAYNGGLSLGGVVAAFGDTQAAILSGYGQGASVVSEVIDSANNGDVYGKAQAYVRSGGIVAIALGVELTSGTDSNQATGAVKKFSYSVPGKGDNIINCNLSNGLNFGNITAVTQTIGQYTGSINDVGENISSSNSQRPGINAAAGGVIAFGLTKMQRMLNHGVVASTDVAGGIVGATYILGGTSTTQNITPVNINTAVHYGRIKAIRIDQYDNITYSAMANIYENNINNTTILYPDNDTSFIFQGGNYNLSIYPNRKRGFGGIFGRLQRGAYGSMRSNNFVNIMNMDPNIDMVGRVDQSSYGSLIFFAFKVRVSGSTYVKDTYYTARVNDTTQATLVGYVTNIQNITLTSAGNISLRITRSGNSNNYSYRVSRIDLTNASGYADSITRKVTVYQTGTGNISAATDITENFVPNAYTINDISQNFTIGTNDAATNLGTYGLTTSDVSGLSYSSNTATYTGAKRLNAFNNSNVKLTMSAAIGTNFAQYHMEKITDDPSDTTKTNIFDPSFPLMDPAQSDFIYAADTDALAERFSEPTSSYYKANGMYVLASHQGRQAGAVLPGNIKINNMYKINEEFVDDEEEPVGEYIDLDNVSSLRLITSGTTVAAFESDFKKMFQLSYNEKSLVLSQKDHSSLADLILYDPRPNGNSPILRGGVIDDDNKKITFTVSNDAFSSDSVYYEVLSARLSEEAVIAIGGIDSTSHAAFNTAYSNRSSNILTGGYKATFSGTVANGATVILPTKLTVYSEIAAEISGLVEKYRTEYDIEIVRESTSLNISLNSIYVDNTLAINPALDNNTYTLTSHDLSSSGKLEVIFNSGSGLLPLDHKITPIGLYYDDDDSDILVSQTYYDLLLNPVDANNLFGFELNLDSLLKAGTYKLVYRYYDSNPNNYSFIFTKASSNESKVLGVDYITYSSDINNEVFSFDAKSDDFTTYIGFGEILNGILYKETNEAISKRAVEDEHAPVYLDNVLYYEILFNEEVIAKVNLSAFSSLSSIETEYSYEGGFKEYQLTYTIAPEVGTPVDIIHTIQERDLENFIVYKNGNSENPERVEILREASLTEIEIDFKFPYASLNDDIETKVYKNSSLFEFTAAEINFNSYNNYIVNITSLLEVGPKEFVFELLREDNVKLTLGSMLIVKLLGTDAYLQDIKFQIESEQTILYPLVSVADSTGAVITSKYRPTFYYAGIDYNGADEDETPVRHFRIWGKVSDIDLEDYHPDFTLPIGATIERKVNGVWSADLFADYIGFGDDEVVIEYRIIAEDGKLENATYYFISAEDITYILTIRFTIYFQKADGTIYEAKNPLSSISEEVVLINVINYKLIEKDENEVPIEYTPYVDENGKIHFPYEDGTIKDYVDSLNTQATLFYFPTIYNNYLYTFGRNLTGAYKFSVVTPIYKGQTTDTLTNGKRYTYNIYLKTGAVGEEEYPWFKDSYILPSFDTENPYSGMYYYILGSPRQIIREFAILIHEETIGLKWGLHDDHTSWDQN